MNDFKKKLESHNVSSKQGTCACPSNPFALRFKVCDNRFQHYPIYIL